MIQLGYALYNVDLGWLGTEVYKSYEEAAEELDPRAPYIMVVQIVPASQPQPGEPS